MKSFLDTNILVYAVVSGDPRADVAERLLAGGAVLGVQALNEFVAVARRKLGMGWKEVEEALAAFRALCPHIVPLTVEVHEQGRAIARRDGLGFYDALMVAAALQAGCTTMYSEDMQDGMKIEGRLTIRNPFRGSA